MHNSSQLGNASDDDEVGSQQTCEYVELIQDKNFKARGFKRQNIVTLKYFLDKRPIKNRDRTGGYEKCLPYSLVIYTLILFVAAIIVHFKFN